MGGSPVMSPRNNNNMYSQNCEPCADGGTGNKTLSSTTLSGYCLFFETVKFHVFTEGL
jgi:hypothetical protein